MSKKKTLEKNLTSEGILDLFKRLWSGERAADDSDPEGDAPPVPVPGPVNAQTVNIQLPLVQVVCFVSNFGSMPNTIESLLLLSLVISKSSLTSNICLAAAGACEAKNNSL